MNNDIIFDFIGDIYRLTGTSGLLSNFFDSMAEASKNNYMFLEQIEESKSIASCPINYESTWLYRVPAWETTKVFHEHIREDFTATAAQLLFTFTVPMFDLYVWQNGVLLKNSDYATTDYTLTLATPAVLNDLIVVMGSKIIEKTISNVSSNLPENGNKYSIRTYLKDWNISGIVTYSSQVLTMQNNYFLAGELIKVVDTINTEIIAVTSKTATLATVNSYTNPSIYRVLNIMIDKDFYVHTPSLKEIKFSSVLPPNTYVTINDCKHQETIVLGSSASSIKYDNSFDSNTIVVKILGGSALTPTISGDKLLYGSIYNKDINVVALIDSYVAHSHVLYSETLTAPASVAILSTPKETDSILWVFVDGGLLHEDQYNVISNLQIQFWDPTAGPPAPHVYPPGTVINIYYTLKLVTHSHQHIKDQSSALEDQYSFTLGDTADPLVLPQQVFVNGVLIPTAKLVDDGKIVITPATLTGGDIFQTDCIGLQYPYITDVDKDITYSYFVDNGLPESYLVKAEYLQGDIAGTSQLTWNDITNRPAEDTFMLKFQAKPSYQILYSSEDFDYLWFKDTYVCRYTLYNTFGIIAGFSKDNSSYYKDALTGYFESMWRGSQQYSIENGANIILGSEYTANSEKMTSIQNKIVNTDKSVYDAGAYDVNTWEKKLKHHAISKILWEEPLNDYLAFFAENYSEEYSLARRMDMREESIIQGFWTGFDLLNSEFTDAATDFELGVAGEVWVGDAVIITNSDSSTYEGHVTKVEQHVLTIDAPDLPYYDPTAVASFLLYDLDSNISNMIRIIPAVAPTGWGTGPWSGMGMSGVLNSTDSVAVTWITSATTTNHTVQYLIDNGYLTLTLQPWSTQPSAVSRIGVYASTSYPVSYKVFARLTERLDTGGRLDQERDVTVLVEQLKKIFVFLKVYKVDWNVLTEDSKKQLFCKVFLDRIHPAFSSYEVYAEKVLSETATIDIPTDTVTLDLSLISYFSLGISALAKGALH